MSINRRSFLRSSPVLAAIPMGLLRDVQLPNYKPHDKNQEVDWEYVRSLFPISEWEKIHFNSGSAGVMPQQTQNVLIELIKVMNKKAPYEAWNDWQHIKSSNIKRLAEIINAHPDELQIVRNTTEALNMIIYGLPIQSGDEVIVAEHDYPFALNAYDNRAKRDGLVVKKISTPLPDSDESIVAQYANAIGPNTKYIHVTFMTHHEAHIMPVKNLVEMAHDRGLEVIIDGAHTLAHIDVDLSDIGADYYATSLHKWLNAPHGTGLIYVQKEKIETLHNHPSSYPKYTDSIDKYEHIGTRAFHQEIGISAALDFHDWLGFGNKKNRLQELNSYWTTQLNILPNVELHTMQSSSYGGAISTFSIAGLRGGAIVKRLDKDYSIHAKSVGLYEGSGVRISVNVFTSFTDLDRLIEAITKIAS